MNLNQLLKPPPAATTMVAVGSRIKHPMVGWVPKESRLGLAIKYLLTQGAQRILLHRIKQDEWYICEVFSDRPAIRSKTDCNHVMARFLTQYEQGVKLLEPEPVPSQVIDDDIPF